MIHILLADDHALIRNSLSRMLATQDDFEVVGIATNGQEALEMVSEHSPDVVLMDLHMPVVDGVTAIETVTRDHPDVAVIALSAFEEPTQVTAALAAGAQGYLIKDVEPEVLFAGIRAALTGGVPAEPASRRATDPQQDVTEPHRLAVGSRTARASHDRRRSHQRADRHGARRQRATVTSVCGRIFKRLELSDRTQAAVWAMSNLPNES